MRNTKLYIIAALVVLVVVVVLATVLTNQFRNSQNKVQDPQDQEKVETTTAKILSRTERLREASRITKQGNTSLLSDDQIKRLDTLKLKIKAGENGMLTTDDFDIGYSDVTNQFYIQKKTDKADVQLESFLTENNALDIYQTDLSLFIKTDQPLTNYIKEQENFLIEQLDEELQPEEKAQSYEEIKKQNFENNLEVLKKLGNSLFSPSSGGVDSLESLLFDVEEDSDSEVQQTENIDLNQLNTQPVDTNIQGILYPPNLGGANDKGYFKMPTAPNGEYVFGGWNTCDSHKYGSRTLIGAIYTAAKNWKTKYPQYTFRIGDLNAGDPHSSHRNGVDVDIVTYGNWSIQINAPTQVNIDLGKAFIDTGVIKLIIFGGEVYNANAPIVQNAWKVYANSKGLPFQTYSYGNHDNHFHVRINDQFRGPLDAPGPCR